MGKHRKRWGCLSSVATAIVGVLTLLTLGGAGTACDEKERPPKIAVVEFSGSAAVKGFHWKIKIQGGNYRERSGYEPTLDMAAVRMEVVQGKDIRVEFTLSAKKGSVLRCQMRSRALAKGSATGAGSITCERNVAQILDTVEYP